MASENFDNKLTTIKGKEVSGRLMQEVSKELGVPLSMVKEIVIGGQSAFTAHTMKSNTFDSVRWIYLGKFAAKTKIAQVLKHMKGLTLIQKEFFFMQKEFAYYRKRFLAVKPEDLPVLPLMEEVRKIEKEERKKRDGK